MLHAIQGMALGKQLRWSFSLLIILLIVVSISGYYGLSSAQSGFTSYRGLALETNLSGRMQANLLYARIGVVKYLSDDNPDILNQYNKRMDKLWGFFETANDNVSDPQRRKTLQKSKDLLQQYDNAFTEVQRLIAKRHDVVNNQLNPEGKGIRIEFTNLLDELNEQNKVEQLYKVAKAEEFLLLGRLYVVKYLVTNSDLDKERADKELKQNLRQALEQAVRSYPSIRVQLESINASLDIYLSAFDSVTEIISDRNAIITGKLNPIGAEVADNLEGMKLGVKAKQDEIGPEVKSTTEFLLSVVSIISIIAVITGGLLAVVLPKLIRKPIGGEPLEIANVAQRIANGDFTQQFGNSVEKNRDLCFYGSNV